PTGGFEVFEFEPHEFSNFEFYNAEQISSSEVTIFAEDKNTGGSTIADLLPKSKAVSVNFEIMINRGNPVQGLAFDDIKTAYAELVKVSNGGAVTKIRTWALVDDMETRQLFNQQGYIRMFEDMTIVPEDNHIYKIYA